MQKNSNQILKTLLALSLVPGLGQKRVKQLVRSVDDPSRIFSLSKTELRSVEGIGEASALAILSFKEWDKVEAMISLAEKIHSQILTIADPVYPSLLKQIYDPPVLLWVKGDPASLSLPGISVVGTRHPTGYGRKAAGDLSGQLAEQGLCIYSGLAYGVDAIAHKAALDAGGKTVAVLGSGIDNLYPREHADLANRIVKEGGAVITEYPPGTAPDAVNFPERNRIVSGMSMGVLVIESGVQGGSMITADLALDQNREVFAVPHTMENLSGSGCNYLIKTGSAKLVQTAEDILEELPVEYESEKASPRKEKKENWRESGLDELSSRVCEYLDKGEMQIDDLADQLELKTSQLLVCLLQLEMKDLVSQKAGKIFSLK